MSSATQRIPTPQAAQREANAASAAKTPEPQRESGRPEPGGPPPVISHDRRRELRERPVGGSALIEGIPFDVFDWNSSGICMRGYDGQLKIGDRMLSHICIESPGKKFDFKCELIIVRRDIARKLIAAVYVGLSRQTRVAIASHFEALERAANERLMAAIAEKP